jgi:hypothetical protein
MARLRDIERHTSGKFKSHELDITYPVDWGREGIEAKLASLCAESVDAIRGGNNILIITAAPRGREQWRFPRCSHCRPCTIIWCARVCAPRQGWWSKPVG